MTNKAASIRQKLLNLSRERRESFDFVLQQYAIQRLLYRLSVSDYSDHFLLKGAMLFLVWTGDFHRPTKDIDLLGFGSGDVDVLVENFKAICSGDTDDGLIFDIDSIQGAQIKDNARYQGVRVTGFAYLEKARISLQVDIGFGDAVTPGAVVATVPSFLDLPDPEMKIYPVYTVIAEKFHAMVALGLFNSRIKDFYDIWVIAATDAQHDGALLNGNLLAAAIKATFERRNMQVSTEMLTVFTDEFMRDTHKHKQWAAFLNKNRLTSDQSFEGLQKELRHFLEPVYQAVALENAYPYEWDATGWQWISTKR